MRSNNLEGKKDSKDPIMESIKSVWSEIHGSMACWLFEKKTNNTYLWKNNNPIMYGKGNNIFAFGSTKYSLPSSITEINEMNSGELYRINQNGIEKIGNINVETNDYFINKPYIYYKDGDDVYTKFIFCQKKEFSENEIKELIEDLNLKVTSKRRQYEKYYGLVDSEMWYKTQHYYRFLEKQGFTISPIDGSISIHDMNLNKFFKALYAIRDDLLDEGRIAYFYRLGGI